MEANAQTFSYFHCIIQFWNIAVAACHNVSRSKFDVVSWSVIGMEPWIWWRVLWNLQNEKNWQENVYYHEEWVCVSFIFDVMVLAWFVGDRTNVCVILLSTASFWVTLSEISRAHNLTSIFLELGSVCRSYTDLCAIQQQDFKKENNMFFSMATQVVLIQHCFSITDCKKLCCLYFKKSWSFVHYHYIWTPFYTKWSGWIVCWTS